MVVFRIAGIRALAMLIALATVIALLPGQARAQGGVDFILQRVWVGADCKIKVRLVRKGGGRLPQHLAKSTALGIKVGAKGQTFTFQEIDPKLVLLQGPGVITFTSPIRVSFSGAIVASFDPKGLFPETSEANNTRRAPQAPKKCLLAAAPPANLDWIEPRRLYLSQDRLHVVLALTSKAAIKSGQLRQVRLMVRSGTQQAAWPLAQVYAQGKRLGRGEVDFNTQLKIKPGVQVRLVLQQAKLVKQQVFTIPKPAGRAKAKGPSGSGGRGVPISLNRGIAIFKPTSSQVAYRGGILSVLYSPSREAPAGQIEFALFRGPVQLSSVRVRYEPPSGSAPAELMLNYRIPRNADVGGGYYIKAVMGGLWGESDRFQVAAVGEGEGSAGTATGSFTIRVVSPSGGNPLPQGSTHMISWRLTGHYPGEPRFVVKLLRGGAPVLTIDSTAAVWHANSRTYTLNWTVPRDLAPGDNYRMQVADRNGPIEDVSDENFSIGGPIVVQGGTGTYYWSQSMTIRYQLPGWTSISHVRILLVNAAGDSVLTINHRHPLYMGNYVWPVGSNLYGGDGWKYSGAHGEPLRGTYRIRIEDADNPAIFGVGHAFTIAEPTVSVTVEPINFEGQTTASRYRINWSSPQLGSSGRVDILIGWYRGSPNYWARPTYFFVARDQPPNGSIIWNRGEQVSGGSYPPSDQRPTWGWVQIVPHSFEELFSTRDRLSNRIYIM